MSNYNQTSSFNTQLARDLGIAAALVYDEIAFWSPKSKNKGWVYKTYEDMMERLPLSKYQLSGAYDALVKAGLMEKKVARANGVPTVHLRVVQDLVFHSEIISLLESEKSSLSLTATPTATPNIDTSAGADIPLVSDEVDGEHLQKGSAQKGSNPLGLTPCPKHSTDPKWLTKSCRACGTSPREYNARAAALLGNAETQLIELCTELGVPRTRVTPGRITKLKQRLKTYTFEEIHRAASIIAKDDFMVAGKYNNIDYLIRNDEKIDMWLQRAQAAEQARPDFVIQSTKSDRIKKLQDIAEGTDAPS